MVRTKRGAPRQAAQDGQQTVLVVESAQCVDCRRIMPLALIWFDPFNGTAHCAEIADCWKIDNKIEEKK